MNTKKIENVVKGFANHRRIQILDHISKHPKLAVEQISEALNVNFVTISNHLQKLARTGLVEKEYRGRQVIHVITKLGKDILTFCKMLE